MPPKTSLIQEQGLATQGIQTEENASIDVLVPPHARLRTACGVHPQHWYRVPSPTIAFAIDLAGASGTQRVYERSASPMRRLGDLAWDEIDLPLDAWADQRVRIEFSTTTDEASGESLWLGGWALPRLFEGADATRPDSETGPAGSKPGKSTGTTIHTPAAEERGR